VPSDLSGFFARIKAKALAECRTKIHVNRQHEICGAPVRSVQVKAVLLVFRTLL